MRRLLPALPRDSLGQHAIDDATVTAGRMLAELERPCRLGLSQPVVDAQATPAHDGALPETGRNEGEMPKETIARTTERDMQDGTVLEERTEELAVVWNNTAENVQVMLGWNRDSGETGESSDRYSPPLTRSQINRTIRVLRRARDQVFGPDA